MPPAYTILLGDVVELILIYIVKRCFDILRLVDICLEETCSLIDLKDDFSAINNTHRGIDIP